MSDILYNHLLGKPFVHGTDDCYSLLQRFYSLNYGIDLPDVARPDDWWSQGLDLYMDHARAVGFLPTDDHPRDYRVSDVFAMAIRSGDIVCHVGIYIGQGMMLHHYFGRISNIELYKGIWKQSTRGVWRHRDVPAPTPPTTSIDVGDLLPPTTRALLGLDR